MDDLRILLVADDPLARAGLAALLGGRPDCKVVGQVSGGEELPDDIAVYRPDVLLWDLGWDPALIHESSLPQQHSIPTVALLPDGTFVGEAWSAGFRNLIQREADGDVLEAALRASLQGLLTFDPALSDLFPGRFHQLETPVEELTPREQEVLQLIAEGLANKAIALRLEISEHTVKFHVNAILGKLNAQSRTDAVVRATRLGLILL